MSDNMEMHWLEKASKMGKYYNMSRDQMWEKCVELETELDTVADLWKQYVEFLQEKYPAKEGEEWQFTCQHHQAIDNVLGNRSTKEVEDEEEK